MQLVSVIVPTKSRPHAIVDAVQSVFAGTYQHFELFVIDQSEDESTREILTPFVSDPRFHYRQNRRPGYGAASSRNVGIALSNGELIAVIDDDVEVRPDWLERIAAEFESDPELQFICGTLTAPPFDPDKGFTPNFRPWPGLSNWRMPFHVAGANVSFRRALFDRVGGYDEFCGPGSRLGASDDGDISFRIMRSGAKWKGVPEIEVVHTHGFRPKTEGDFLQRRYQRGNGGNFGRHTRRGDLVAGGWFLLREGLHILKLADPRLSRADRKRDWLTVWDHMVGFRRGLILSPKEGFVTGSDLRRMRTQLSEEKVPVTVG